MKYIRTKDGRIYQVREGFEGKEWENSDEYFYRHYHSRADTIKELCDEFVLLNHKETGKPFLDKDLEFLKNASKLGYDIRGAIWTNKGLIYRAKMKGILPNGEIDWELL